jgi:hypothetical protein
MTTQWDGAINCTTTRTGTSGQIRYTIYGENDAQIYTQDVNSGTVFFYEFPSSGGILLSNGFYLFKVVIKVATINSLATFRFNTKTNYAPSGWPVVEAHIKAPTLTALTYAFQNQKALKYIKFYGNHNQLNNLSYFADGCSGLVELQAGVEMNALTSISYLCNYATNLEILTLPPTMDLVINTSYAFQGCGLKSNPPLPNSLPECTTALQMFYSMQRLAGTLYIPDMPKCTNVTNMASLLPLITKIVCRGSYIPSYNGQTASFQNNPSLVEIDMGNTWGKSGVTWPFGYIIEGCPALKKLTLPVTFLGINSATSGLYLTSALNFSVTELSTANWSDCIAGTVYANFGKLVSFNQPTLKATSLNMNFSSSRPGSYEYIEIDWANSTFTASGINVSYNKLSATELNRIFTALPAATATITITGNPGAATCTRSIATAKGWTVTG